MIKNNAISNRVVSELINYYNNKGANAKIDRDYLYGGISIKNLVIDWSNA